MNVFSVSVLLSIDPRHIHSHHHWPAVPPSHHPTFPTPSNHATNPPPASHISNVKRLVGTLVTLPPHPTPATMPPSDLAKAFATVVNARYSCKTFNPDKPVPADILRSITEMTSRAPTSFNTQPWIAVVVQGAAAKRRLGEAMAMPNRVRRAGRRPMNYSPPAPVPRP